MTCDSLYAVKNCTNLQFLIFLDLIKQTSPELNVETREFIVIYDDLTFNLNIFSCGR